MLHHRDFEEWPIKKAQSPLQNSIRVFKNSSALKRLAPFYLWTAWIKTILLEINLDVNFLEHGNLITKPGEQFFSLLHPK